jgi:hypothetical protein
MTALHVSRPAQAFRASHKADPQYQREGAPPSPEARARPCAHAVCTLKDSRCAASRLAR